MNASDAKATIERRLRWFTIIEANQPRNWKVRAVTARINIASRGNSRSMIGPLEKTRPIARPIIAGTQKMTLPQNIEPR